MTQGFDEWFDFYENLQCDKDSCEDAFEAGAASRQAEIDELQKRINSMQEIMSAGVYHIPTLIKDLNNALKGESNE